MRDPRYDFTYSELYDMYGKPIKVESVKLDAIETSGEHSIPNISSFDCSGFTITLRMPKGKQPALKALFGLPMSWREVRLLMRNKEKQRRKQLKEKRFQQLRRLEGD